MDCCPVVFEPRYVSKIWGGRRLETWAGRRLPPGQNIGESWECADLPGFSSAVSRGPMRGRTLQDLLACWGADLLGDAAPVDQRFPLLIKFLDAAADLSIQVHPGEGTSGHGGHPSAVKHEAWYVLQAEPAASIYRGLASGVTVDSLRGAWAADPARVVGCLQRIPAGVGDTFYLPGGTPHALGAGLLVAEVQTPSDVTYRLYDWGRTRPAHDAGLHRDEALACIRPNPDFAAAELNTPLPGPFAATVRRIACPCFTLDECRHPEGETVAFSPGRMRCWVFISGHCEIGWGAGNSQPCAVGEVVLWPAAVLRPWIRPHRACRWLEISVPANR